MLKIAKQNYNYAKMQSRIEKIKKENLISIEYTIEKMALMKYILCFQHITTHLRLQIHKKYICKCHPHKPSSSKYICKCHRYLPKSCSSFSRN